MMTRHFRCPYCGQDVYYYGDTLAICSSGVRLHPSDIPAGLIYRRVWSFGRRPLSMEAIMSSPMTIDGNPNPIPTNQAMNLIIQGLIKR